MYELIEDIAYADNTPGILVSIALGSKIYKNDAESFSPLFKYRRSLKVSNSSPGCLVVRKLGLCNKLRISPMRPAPSRSLAKISIYLVLS